MARGTIVYTGNYGVIVFDSAEDVLHGNGRVYGWYEELATALKTATNLNQNGVYHAVAFKTV
jgi:hypothetical protein